MAAMFGDANRLPIWEPSSHEFGQEAVFASHQGEQKEPRPVLPDSSQLGNRLVT